MMETAENKAAQAGCLSFWRSAPPAEQSYEESGLRFAFGPDWAVQRYDAHRFYQGLSGVGLKGVDFIGLHQGRLYLIEVKNYRRRQAWQAASLFAAIAADPSPFAAVVARKMTDTLRAISAIRTYYHRKWLFRQAKPWLLRRPPRQSEWAFWAQVCEIAQAPSAVTAVLWLETEQPQAPIRQALQAELATALDGQLGEVRVVRAEGEVLPGLWVGG